MILARVAAKQPIFATMVIAALLIFGWIAFTRLPVLMFPELDFPLVSITTVLPGADPETIESKVTEVIEDSVGVLEGIKTLKSINLESVSQVVIEFTLDKDIDIVTQDVRDKIAIIRNDLPTDVEEPLVQKFDINAMPILQIAISSEMSIKDLTEFVDKRIKNNIEKIQGVGNVQIVGGRERQIRVWLDSDKLRGYELTADDVVMTLQTGNINFPGGTMKSDVEELMVKTQGEVEKASDFQNLVISSIDGKPVTIGDVAYVEDGEEDAETFSRLNNEQAVSLLVVRRSDANEIALANNVKKELERLQERYKDQIKIVVAQDTSTFTQEAVNDINTSILYGGIFAILVILLFFRNISATVIAALSIPVSLISAFMVMSVLGFTMNMMSMMGLALSVGILIDDSIVVIENIFRHREMGEKRIDAAINGTSEIGLAVTAATMTIIAVFVPVAFMSGIMGQFFYEFGLTVAGAVMVSLFVSFWLTPMLSSKFLRRKHKFTAFDVRFEKGMESLNKAYSRSLEWALNNRWKVVSISIALILVVFIMAGAGVIKSEFMTSMERTEFVLNIETPIGFTVEQTDMKTREIEKIIQEKLEDLTGIFTTVGYSSGGVNEPNKAQILISIPRSKERDKDLKDIMKETRELVSGVTDVIASTGEASTMSGAGFSNKMLQFSLTGNDLDELEVKGKAVLDKLSTMKGFVDMDSSLRPGKPEIDIHINRHKAADLGVNVFGIASTVNTLIGGKQVTTFQEGGDQYEVWVRLRQNDRDKPQDLEKLMVRSNTGQLIDITNVAEYERGKGPSRINRLNKRREVEITGNLEGLPLGSAVEIINKVCAEELKGSDIELVIGGEAEVMIEAFEELSFTLMMAIIIIYMVLASQFGSFVHPLTIMVALPLSIIGAFLLLLITGKTISIISFIGIIMLMGIVTKNSILLIDLTNQLRVEGMERDKAIKTAGPQRLRPILMTALSTILGVLPVALEFGEGAEMRSPMAIAVIGGLLTSTFLTLLVIPVVYTIFDDMREWKLFKSLVGLIRTDN
ncbi:MAG: efflux RND transporter permease subunit [Acidobacteria bacterium]|nr:efflux RND transporter permease subunit [Acidobacteriota bacterium]